MDARLVLYHMSDMTGPKNYNTLAWLENFGVVYEMGSDANPTSKW
jgi:hypothetical protein